MWAAIAAFELKTQLRSPVFAIVSVLTGLLVFGSVVTERIRIGPAVDGLRNGPEAIWQVHGVWSVFFTFTAVAFAAEAVLRDEATRFAPVLRATGVGRGAYFWGRFAGAFATVVTCFLAVPIGMAAASFAPGTDPAVIGPVRWEAHAAALGWVALPNLFLLSAVTFALATRFRSAMAGYLGAVALVVLYGWGGERVGATPPLLEPFGFAAVREGGLLANRALWTAVGAGALLAAFAGFRLEARPGRVRAEAPADDPPPALAMPPTAPTRRGRGAAWAPLVARTRWEMRAVFGSAPFAVVTALGAINAAGALWAAAEAGAGTEALIARLIESFRLVPTAVAIFYAGELVWAERDARVHEIVGAAPAPDWAFLLPKLLALAGVLLALLGASAAAGVAIDAARGAPGVDQGAWLRLYVLPRSFDWLVFAALALFLQTVSPSKLAGWGWAVLVLIAQLTLESQGLNDGLYRYGGRLDGPLAELLARDAGRGALLRLYWGGFAVLLIALGYALHGRGAEPRWRGRLAQAGRRLRGPAGSLAAAAGAGFVGLGFVIALS